ncbi:peptidase M14 [Flavobacterium sp. CYK-55]|uniref:M14 family metallopeptidase n=1 Tax=Flavobacterium sp. CYK-55 TaxID=2835529 RepID=UPI001BCD2E57|nr:M14 metallopeptidase family protein [Flavobacterium sp. CYK-55]MBS7786632.1 peptidase M14 [Flavobacterium sp. CYK-55]
MNTAFYANQYRQKTISGRYLNLEHIEPLLQKLPAGSVTTIGSSVQDRPLYAVTLGTGAQRILMWSQMHGNESTTTKALFDFFNFLTSAEPQAKAWLEHFTLMCLPMLNPDGSQAYTRENAVGIDLNRDAQSLSQPESRALRSCFEKFEPHYCFNLHDQRTIYAVGNTHQPATVSFLAPAYNFDRDINATRLQAIEVIVAMNLELQKYIPGQVGRFDDAFNLNCVGDTFQAAGVPTILFEAGHHPEDYEREHTRKWMFIALFSSLQYIYENVVVSNKTQDYLNIPQNKVAFFDIVYKNVKINYDGIEKNTNFAIQFVEELYENQIRWKAVFAQIGDLNGFHGHQTFDAKGALYSDNQNNIPKLESKADFYLGKNTEIVNGVSKNL